MKIKNSLLNPVEFKRSPNIGASLKPIGIIVHYTASPTLDSAVNWILNKESKVSYHILIGRDGRIVQTCPFNRIAWHAGISEYLHKNKILSGLNRFTIGVALDNMGLLHKRGVDYVDRITGRVVREYTIVNNEAWHNYTQIQLDTLKNVCLAIKEHYKIQFIAGHSEVATGRKIDPGALFNMDEFRKEIL